MYLTKLFNRTRTLAVVYALFIIVSSYPQPLKIPPTTANKFTKKLYYKKISIPPTTPAEWVSVAGLFSLPIVQQPVDNPIYVANKPDLLTQFQQANQNGITGLLAHNFLSGKEFSKLKIGQEVSVTYTDHIVKNYRVASIYHYQKLDPSDLFSILIDLHTEKELTTEEVFSQFYRGRHHVTFQTCIEKEGRLDWGLLFVVALPTN